MKTRKLRLGCIDWVTFAFAVGLCAVLQAQECEQLTVSITEMPGSGDRLEQPIIAEFNVPFPARDGVELAVCVFRLASNRPLPVLMTSTPHGIDPAELTQGVSNVLSGYALVTVNWRGTGCSGGSKNVVDRASHLGEDLADAIDWIRSQGWCNGKVGLAGTSRQAIANLAALGAEGAKPDCAVITSGAHDWYSDILYEGGGAFATWHMGVVLTVGPEEQLDTEFLEDDEAFQALQTYLPLQEQPALWATHGADPGMEAFLAHPSEDTWWDRFGIAPNDFGRIDIPILLTSGWYDLFSKATIHTYRDLVTVRHSEQGRNSVRLLMGPWDHLFSEVNLSQLDPYQVAADSPEILVESRQRMVRLHEDFFALYLKGEGSEDSLGDPIQVFTMGRGRNEWRSATSWPLPDIVETPFYFGRDGSLDSAENVNGGEPDSFEYDPADPLVNPVSMIGTLLTQIDWRKILERADVLMYTSEPLQSGLEIIGSPRIILHASSTARDTDWSVRLLDIFRDGFAKEIAYGHLRARYRSSFENPTLVEPGAVYEYEIELTPTANFFAPGHRIQVMVTSSNVPVYDRNTNTGNPVGADSLDEARTATQHIYHDEAHPSRVIFPVFPE